MSLMLISKAEKLIICISNDFASVKDAVPLSVIVVPTVNDVRDCWRYWSGKL